MSVGAAQLNLPGPLTATYEAASRGAWSTYTRESFKKDGAGQPLHDWVRDDNLVWTSFDQTVQPAMPTAQLRYLGKFGYTRRNWEAAHSVLLPEEYLGKYVQIRQTIAAEGTAADTSDLTTAATDIIRFTGRVEQQRTTYEGSSSSGDDTYYTGMRQTPVLGLESLLDFSLEVALAEVSGAAERIEHVPAMNRRSSRGGTVLGNRSDAEITTTIDGTDYTSYVHSADGDVWTHDDYLVYLVRLLNQEIYLGAGLKFGLMGDFDALQQMKTVKSFSRQSVRSILNTLIPRRLGLWWRCEMNQGDLDDDTIYIEVGKAFRNHIELPDGNKIRGNVDLLDLSQFDDRLATPPEILESSRAACNYVRVVGNRVTVTGTWAFDEGVNPSTLEAGWAATQETAFQNRHSTAIAPPDPRYRDVYRKFRVPSDWNGELGDGDGGGQYSTNIALEDGGTVRTDLTSNLWLGEKRFLARTRLQAGVDYTVTPPSDGNPSGSDPQFLPSMAAIKDGANYIALCNDGPDDKWSSRFPRPTVRPDDHDFAMRIEFPKPWMLAKNHWSPSHGALADIVLDYSKLILTATYEIDQPCQVFERVSEDVLQGQDKERVIHVEDARLDLLMPSTVVGASADGTDLQWSPNVDQELRNDIPKLQALAALAKMFYGQTRRKVKFTYRKLTTIGDPGFIVTKIPGPEDIEVNAIVSRITWNWGGEGDHGSVTVQTDYSELDPVGFGQAILETANIRSADSLDEILETLKADGVKVREENWGI